MRGPLSSPSATTTIISASTLGAAGALGRPPRRRRAFYHFAVHYAHRRDLAAALKRLLDAGVLIDSTSDCAGAADSIYLRDPDQNGLELTWDRPPETRPNPPPTEDQPLDLDELLGELG
jgi:catechol 2,3-dioxygenase